VPGGADGLVYPVGGADASGAVAPLAPDSGGLLTQSGAHVLAAGRYDLAAATDPDGRIYALGGRTTDSSESQSVHAYDPGTDTWTALAHLPTARAELAAAAGPDGRIYAIGGYSTGTGALSAVDAYSPETDTWAAVAPLRPPGTTCRRHGRRRRIYAIGGRDSADDELGVVEATRRPRTRGPQSRHPDGAVRAGRCRGRRRQRVRDRRGYDGNRRTGHGGVVLSQRRHVGHGRALITARAHLAAATGDGAASARWRHRHGWGAGLRGGVWAQSGPVTGPGHGGLAGCSGGRGVRRRRADHHHVGHGADDHAPAHRHDG